MQMKLSPLDSERRSTINHCDSCGGDHEVMLKTVNDKLKEKGFTYWFECPQHAQGGPIMVTIEPEKAVVVPEVVVLPKIVAPVPVFIPALEEATATPEVVIDAVEEHKI